METWDELEDLFSKQFGPCCYVKYNEGESMDDVFVKAKKFNSSKEFEKLRVKFFYDAERIKSYEEADKIFKNYIKDLKGIFCVSCMRCVLPALDTKEYQEFRNVPSKIDLKPIKDEYCTICHGNINFSSDQLKMCEQCKHHFHTECIKLWSMKSEKCRICGGYGQIIDSAALYETYLFDR